MNFSCVGTITDTRTDEDEFHLCMEAIFFIGTMSHCISLIVCNNHTVDFSLPDPLVSLTAMRQENTRQLVSESCGSQSEVWTNH